MGKSLKFKILALAYGEKTLQCTHLLLNTVPKHCPPNKHP